MANTKTDQELINSLLEGMRAPEYHYKYFTGTQTSIYIGDVFVEEISNFVFAARSPVRPVYSYNSINFDLILRENSIVVGSFAINYVKDDYLFVLLNEYSREKLSANSDAEIVDELNKLIDDNSEKAIIEAIVRQYNRLFMDTRNDMNEKELGKTQIDRSTKILRDIYWASGGALQQYPTVDSNFRKISGDEESGQMASSLHIPFNFTIVYGDLQPLSVDEVSGASEYSQTVSANAQLNVLKNVIITSAQKQVDQSGKPIQEVYQFIARNAF